jgi:hypothetical protein
MASLQKLRVSLPDKRGPGSSVPIKHPDILQVRAANHAAFAAARQSESGTNSSFVWRQHRFGFGHERGMVGIVDRLFEYTP